MDLCSQMLSALRAAHVAAYEPRMRVGRCAEPYVVVEDLGVAPMGKTVGYRAVLVTGYAPRGQPGRLRPLLTSARRALQGATPARATGEVSPDSYDEETEAYRASVEYRALCALS